MWTVAFWLISENSRDRKQINLTIRMIQLTEAFRISHKVRSKKS